MIIMGDKSDDFNIDSERMKDVEITSIPDTDLKKATKKGGFFGDPFLVIE